eukprot:GSChrysophyteH1.ASY1.ANO1.1843.1 assembled CDS
MAMMFFRWVLLGCLMTVWAVDVYHDVLDSAKGVINYQITTISDTQRHIWTISVASASRIMLVFEIVEMHFAEVQISQTSATGDTDIFFNCPSCGVLIPPPFESNDSTVTITALGHVDAVGFQASRFKISYYSILDVHDSSQDAVTFRYFMGYAHVQPLLLSDGTLPPGVVQRWEIDASAGAVSNAIRLAVAGFNFPSGCTTTLTIYDDWDNLDNQLYSGCGDSDLIKNWLYSDTGRVYVIVDNTGNSQALPFYFKLTYLGEKSLYNCGSLSGQEDALTADSSFFSDGSRPSFDEIGALRPSMNCRWLIQPTSGGDDDKITLMFNRVSLYRGSRVVVYDNFNASGPILWDSGQQFSYSQFGSEYAGRSITVPPPIISTAKALYVVYISGGNEDRDYHGFVGEYHLNDGFSRGVGSGESLLRMSSAIDVSLPGTQLLFPKDWEYTYKIAPDNIDAGARLTFAVNRINLPNAGDSLFIYDGLDPSNDPLLVELSGRVPPLTWFQTTGSDATLVFRSNGDSLNWGDINLNFFSDGPNYHCGFTRNPAKLESPAMVLTDGSKGDDTLFKGQNCQWLVEPYNSAGIFLYFTYFEVQGGFLEIYKSEYNPDWTWTEWRDNRIAIIENSMAIPAPMFLPYSKIGFRYVTDENPLPSGKGFHASYYRMSGDKLVESLPGDGVIKVFSSSLTHLGNNEQYGYIQPMLDLTYQVNSIKAENDYMYFAFASMNLTSCHAHVRIYDGPSNSSPLLGSYCGANLNGGHSWVKTSSSQATVTFISDGEADYFGDFSLGYYSNGPNNHCGFSVNPGYLKHQSMLFTDGSAESEKMYPDQNCFWIIEPDQIEELKAGTNTGFIALEFIYNDLRGGEVEIYSGPYKDPAQLLWRCADCQIIPRPIISKTGLFYVYYKSRAADEVATYGKGFKAVYWSVDKTTKNTFFDTYESNGVILESPPGLKLQGGFANNSIAWHLGLTEGSINNLKFSPRVISDVTIDEASMAASVRDGRPAGDLFNFQSFNTTALTCGNVVGDGKNVLQNNIDEDFAVAATQWAGAYIESTETGKKIHELSGSNDLALSDPVDPQHEAAPVCKYILDSGSAQSITIGGTFTNPLGTGRLQIFGGKFGNDAVIYDSGQPANFNPQTFQGIKAPCGRALVLLSVNQTVAGDNVGHSLDLNYFPTPGDKTGDCEAYYISLLPVIIEVNPWIPYYIAMGSLCGSCLLFLCALYIRKLSHKYYPENGCNPFKRIRIYKIVTPRHLSYTPKWDAFRNKFLKTGECAICQDVTKVFNLKPCNHKLCEEDMAGYLGAALGDISLFPVKCPLHYEGCTSTIDAHIAKRVLDKLSFDKFNQFSDRVKYGEGMRCIFCNNYVNFPDEGAFSMVECPYCIQTFCIRCKKPWHFGSKCPLENVDDTLTEWKKMSGAQKCPACSKLIEKSDAETCNHMIHKITDGIPCIKDRTDFCYCCGMEVLGDYPHEEVERPGVNHFPDGVYQKCLTIIKKERDSERARLKKLRRLKERPGGGLKQRQQSFNGLEMQENGQVAVDDDGWEKIPAHLLQEEVDTNRGLNARLGDVIDQQWDAEMTSGKYTAQELAAEDSDSDVSLGQEMPSEKVVAPVVAPVYDQTPTRGTRPKPSPSPKKVSSPQVAMAVPPRNPSKSSTPNSSPSPSRRQQPSPTPSRRNTGRANEMGYR